MEHTKEIKTDELDEKRVNIINFLKNKWNYLVYILLAAILWLGAFIRTRNLPHLIDQTTGKYIPIALDPHLFLRYARMIAENGALPAIDMMRFVPFGKVMASIEVLIPYTIFYIYKAASIFSKNITLEYIDVVYPVVFFVLAGIFFFLLVRRLFNHRVAILATAFLTLIPAFLFRTIAGFSEKEPMAMFFMFAAYYFYIRAWQSQNLKPKLVWAILAGVSTGLFGMVSGLVKFALMTIAIFTLVEILLSKFGKRDIYIYTIWVVISIFMLTTLTAKYGGLLAMLRSFSSGLSVFVLGIAFVDYLIFKKDLINIKSKLESKLPSGIWSFIIAVILSFIVATIIFGPSFMFQQVSEIFFRLLNPIGVNRWLLTVAENQHPFFTNLLNQF